MDIKKDRIIKKSNLANKLLIPSSILIIFVFTLFWYQSTRMPTSETVNRSDITIGKVKKGKLNISIKGFGKLISNKQVLHTSLVEATVAEIVLKPGAKVELGSIILKLENIKLFRELDGAKQSLFQEQANLRMLLLNHKRELLNLDIASAQNNAQQKVIQMQLNAEKELSQKGIVSAIEYNKTKVASQGLKIKIALEKEKREQLLLTNKEEISIFKGLILLKEILVKNAKELVDSLTVRSKSNGVIQNLTVTVGQSLSIGEPLALISSTSDLVALLRIPQTQAQNLELGQQANIDTRRDVIGGEVIRIDPAVTNGSVTVEIALISPLPLSARPELNIDGTINIAALENVLYIDRPAHSIADRELALFKFDKKSGLANKFPVVLGKISDEFVQIKSGVYEGEQLILSDMSRFKHLNVIQVKN